MSKYFENVNDLQKLRRQYRDLLKKFHPDNANGSTEASQQIIKKEMQKQTLTI